LNVSSSRTIKNELPFFINYPVLGILLQQQERDYSDDPNSSEITPGIVLQGWSTKEAVLLVYPPQLIHNIN
jgi:hypothetical protein